MNDLPFGKRNHSKSINLVQETYSFRVHVVTLITLQKFFGEENFLTSFFNGVVSRLTVLKDIKGRHRLLSLKDLMMLKNLMSYFLLKQTDSKLSGLFIKRSQY